MTGDGAGFAMARLTPLSLLIVAACWLEPGGAPANTFRDLLGEAWSFELEAAPLAATLTGDDRFNDRLGTISLEEENRRAQARREYLERLGRIDRMALNEQDRITYSILERDLRDRIEEHELGGTLMPFLPDDGFHIAFAQLPSNAPFRDTRDYENYIARLRAFPAWIDGWMGVLREGVRTGATTPRVVLEGYEGTMSAHVVDDPQTSLFWAPFVDMPGSVPAPDQERLRDAGRAAITDAIVPAYRTLLDFFTSEYLPGARTTIGASELPGGREFYAHRINMFTTLDLTPDSIHATGLREVERIRGEMQAIIDQVGFQGDFAAFLRFLRTDARRADARGVVHREAHGWQAAVSLRQAAAPTVRRRASAGAHRAQVHGRPLRERAPQLDAAGLLLGEHLRAREPAAVRARVAHAP